MPEEILDMTDPEVMKENDKYTEDLLDEIIVIKPRKAYNFVLGVGLGEEVSRDTIPAASDLASD